MDNILQSASVRFFVPLSAGLAAKRVERPSDALRHGSVPDHVGPAIGIENHFFTLQPPGRIFFTIGLARRLKYRL
jgi:hypothetical protein